MLRKVIEIDIHQLRKFHELEIELGFIMQAHRYRSGLQRYKAARNPLAVLVFVRELQKCSAQTPA